MAGGRPFKASPPPRPVLPLTNEEMAQIAPLASDNERIYPDMFNYMPTRHVPLDEAKTRGWPHFWQGELCRYGHSAPRYVNNPRQCVDCLRMRKGRSLLGAAPTTALERYDARAYKPREVTTPGPTSDAPAKARAVALPEPDRTEKLFLVRYAETRDLDGAAIAAGTTAAQIIARLSWSKVFSDAVRALEDKLGIVNIPQSDGPFEWDDVKRDRLIEVYVDTGDIATARDSIRVTPSEYFREIAGNDDFAAQVEEAQGLATRALEERATQLALAGNDKLLTKILSAKIPEYRDNLKIDMNVTEKNLTDDQLNAKLVRLLGKQRAGRTFDAESEGEAGPAALTGRADAPRLTQSNQDLL